MKTLTLLKLAADGISEDTAVQILVGLDEELEAFLNKEA